MEEATGVEKSGTNQSIEPENSDKNLEEWKKMLGKFGQTISVIQGWKNTRKHHDTDLEIDTLCAKFTTETVKIKLDIYTREQYTLIKTMLQHIGTHFPNETFYTVNKLWDNASGVNDQCCSNRYGGSFTFIFSTSSKLNTVLDDLYF